MIRAYVEALKHRLTTEQDEIAHSLAKGGVSDMQAYAKLVGRYEQIDRTIELITEQERKTLHDDD